jgi:hypothetical protein
MTAPALKLRGMQIACVIMILACIVISRLQHHEWQGTITPRHWFVIVAVIWSAIAGFTLQRRIVNRPASSRKPSSTSTPFTRWRAGHICWLLAATSVGLWELVLSDFAGPRWLVNIFFGAGLLLLLMWTPGPAPPQTL